MVARRLIPWLALLGLAAIARPAAGAELYSFVDADGVMHLTNVPTDSRYRRVKGTGDVGGLYRRSSTTSDRYASQVREAARRYQLPEALLFAVMAVESSFDARAVSEKGAVGLMQLMPTTAREMYVGDALDPAQNIEGGARYLRILANQYGGDMVKMLAAYNAGPEAVRRAGEQVPSIPETREYVRKVVALYHSYRAGR